MSISFAFRHGVQIVQFPGPLSPEEAAAVRLKIDQKISSGRQLILFYLFGFPLSDTQSRSRLLDLIQYCLQRGVQLSVAGADPIQWPLLHVPGQRQAKLYSTEAEALAIMSNPEEPNVAAAVVGVTRDLDKEMRLRSIEEVIRKYMVYQNPNEWDPFSLEKMETLFRRTRAREALVELDKAIRDIPKRLETIHQLQADAQRLSQETLELSLRRKEPMTENEVKERRAELQQAIDALRAEQIKVSADIEVFEAQLSEGERKIHSLRSECDSKRAALHEQLLREKSETEKLKQQIEEEHRTLEAQAGELESRLRGS